MAVALVILDRPWNRAPKYYLTLTAPRTSRTGLEARELAESAVNESAGWDGFVRRGTKYMQRAGVYSTEEILVLIDP